MSNTEPVFVDIALKIYKRGILNAIIVPRPIGWMSTVDGEGNANLAPYSYFNIMSVLEAPSTRFPNQASNCSDNSHAPMKALLRSKR